MLVIWKGRGLLTALYPVISIALMAFLTVYLEDWFGGVFIQDNTIMFAMALAFILAEVGSVLLPEIVKRNY